MLTSLKGLGLVLAIDRLLHQATYIEKYKYMYASLLVREDSDERISF